MFVLCYIKRFIDNFFNYIDTYEDDMTDDELKELDDDMRMW